jgi:hypothetical protein
VNDQQVIEYHARRLVVAPPRRYRARFDSLHRLARGLKHVVDYGFIVVYALLAARLVLLLLPGSMGGVLSRMLAPLTDPLILPFDNWLPEPALPEHLSLLLPILAAALAAFVMHRLAQVVLRVMARPRVGTVQSMRTSLVHRI